MARLRLRGGLLHTLARTKLSGEILKEPFVDMFVTDSEQTAFCLNRKAQTLKESYSTETEYDQSAQKTRLGGAPLNQAPKRSFDSSEARTSRLPRPAPQSTQKTRGGYSQRSLDVQAVTSKHVKLDVKVGDYVCCGDQVGESFGSPLVVNTSGQIIAISESQLVLQKTQPVLCYSKAHVHVKGGEWVEHNAPILTLTHQTLVTGDIVQGIPRIEQLFEAPNSPPRGLREGGDLHETLHSQIREIFRNNWIKLALPSAVRQSLEQIQLILVESIQKVYLSQGVLISDKHIEIVVRQMTSKAEVLDSGDTGLLLEELLPVQHIENTNLNTPGKKALYAPVVVGLTRSALESDSFISAASFQETTRVLSRDAIIGKSDFLRGLKEKVVIGDLISAGTGLDAYSLYTLLSPGKALSSDTTDTR